MHLDQSCGVKCLLGGSIDIEINLLAFGRVTFS
jgi:hypothetical protein